MKHEHNTFSITNIVISIGHESFSSTAPFLPEIFALYVSQKVAPRRQILKSTTQTSLGSRMRSIQDMIKIFLHLIKQVQEYIQRENFVIPTLIGDSTNFYVNLVRLNSKGL